MEHGTQHPIGLHIAPVHFTTEVRFTHNQPDKTWLQIKPVNGYIPTEKEWENMNNLIFAAPDLLDAIRPLVATINGIGHFRVKPEKREIYLEAARKAIAKAEGRA